MNWNLYRSSEIAWREMLDSCRNAQVSIDLEQFIFIDDDIGQKFIDICAERAKSGVKVRFLWDAAGSFSFSGKSLVEELKNKGITLRFFKTLIPRSAWNHRLWFFRNHRRSLVVDGKVAYIGSASIWEESYDWIETHIKVTGRVVASVTEAFEQVWRRSAAKTYRWDKKQPVLHGDTSYVTNSPIRKMRYLYKQVYDALDTSKHYIAITTPYFCPDHTMFRQLIKARKRGVAVHILLTEKSDHFYVDLAAQSYFTRLLKAGVRIFLYKKGMLHSKSILADNWATVGTLNFDTVSLRYNFEANLVSTNPDFVLDIKRHFESDLMDSKEVLYKEWKNRSSLQKALEWAIVPFRPLL